MGKLFLIIFLQAVTFGSLTGISVGSFSDSWRAIGYSVAAFAVLLAAGLEIRAFLETRPKTFKEQHKINAYMKRLLETNGRSVIFSRDMSWTHENDVKKLLLDKAKKQELILCLKSMIPLAEELRAAGAEVFTYDELGHVPESRFTIVDFEKFGAKVSVGGKVNGVHQIQEFSSGQHPFFSVSEDLVKILMAMARKKP